MPAFAPVLPPSPKRTSSTERTPGPRITTVNVTGSPVATGLGLATTLTVSDSVVVVLEAIEVVEVAGGTLVFLFDVLVVFADFPPLHDVAVTAASPRHAMARQNLPIRQACPDPIERPRGFGPFTSSPNGLAPELPEWVTFQAVGALQMSA